VDYDAIVRGPVEDLVRELAKADPATWGPRDPSAIADDVVDELRRRSVDPPRPVGDARDLVGPVAAALPGNPGGTQLPGGRSLRDVFPKVADAYEGKAPGAGLPLPIIDDAIRAFVVMVANTTGFLLGEETAKNIDTSGNLFSFVGSLNGAIINQRRLTQGPLSFQEVLQVENRVAGMRTVLIVASFIFKVVVELIPLTQLSGLTGLILHMIDDVVGDAARILTTQIVRRAVSIPLERGYARIHRFKDLAAAEAQDALLAGVITEAEYVDVLVSESYTDRAIQAKVSHARLRALEDAQIVTTKARHVSPAELAAALKAGIIDEAEYVLDLRRLGYDDYSIGILFSLVTAKLPKTAPAPGG